MKQRFSPERLESVIVGVAARTAENVSSMLMDVRRGMVTEIEYINGYIVKKGDELGIKCFMNHMIMHLVMAKRLMANQEKELQVPFLEQAKVI